MKRTILSFLALLVASGVMLAQAPSNVEKASRFQIVQQTNIPGPDLPRKLPAQ